MLFIDIYLYWHLLNNYYNRNMKVVLFYLLVSDISVRNTVTHNKPHIQIVTSWCYVPFLLWFFAQKFAFVPKSRQESRSIDFISHRSVALSVFFSYIPEIPGLLHGNRSPGLPCRSSDWSVTGLRNTKSPLHRRASFISSLFRCELGNNICL